MDRRFWVGRWVVFNNNKADYALRNAADFRGMLSAAHGQVSGDGEA